MSDINIEHGSNLGHIVILQPVGHTIQVQSYNCEKHKRNQKSWLEWNKHIQCKEVVAWDKVE